MEFTPNQTVGHYRLVQKIGEGGMGVVWRAVDTTLDREVAIKVLPDLFAEDPDRLARFEREAKLLASLNHPGIATIHGLHQAGDVRFLAMELAPGVDLERRLGEGPIPIDEALAIALKVAEALEAAHESGVVHRDLKPAAWFFRVHRLPTRARLPPPPPRYPRKFLPCGDAHLTPEPIPGVRMRP